MIINKGNYDKVKLSGHQVKTAPCKNGLVTLEISKDGRDRLIHSKYDPVGEARKQTEIAREIRKSPAIFVFGLGMGYHVYEILRISPKEAKITVFEPCAEALRIFFEQNGLSLLDDKRLSIQIFEKKDKANLEMLTIENCDAFAFFAQPVYAQIFGEEHDSLVRQINRETTSLLTQKGTIRRYGVCWSANFLANYPQVRESAAVKGLFGEFKGKAAVIVSAGPSLSKNVRELAKVREGGVIICCDTAFKALAANGIKPDIIVTTSGSPSAPKKLEGAAYDYPLVYKSQSAKEILSGHKGIKFYAQHINNFLDAALKERGIEAGFLDSGGSVACSCVDLAAKMGVDTVIFVGQDLALTGGKAYAEHTSVPFDEIASEIYITETDDIYGQTVRTLQNLNAYRRWIEQYIEIRGDLRFIDATEGGALISGTEVMTLAEALAIVPEGGIANEEIISRAFHGNRLKKGTEITDRRYREAFHSFQDAKKIVNEIISDYEARRISRERVKAEADALLALTEAVKYSILASIYDIKNINVTELPDIAYFKKIASALEGLTGLFGRITEVK